MSYRMRFVAPLLQAVNLERHYQMGQVTVRALDGVSMNIDDGEMVALLGRSGSGKSTLLNLVAGMDKPTGGALLFRGQEMGRFNSRDLALHRRKNVGMVFQSFNLLSRKTALENVMLPMMFADKPEAERRERARELLVAVGLGERAGHRPTELSGGEQQRVAIARALANEPELLLADEPTGNLDTRTAEEILQVLSRLHREMRKSMLLVTHDERVAEIAQRRIFMSDGKVAETVSR
jgi:putative ABC transport system ATP-binding protein